MAKVKSFITEAEINLLTQPEIEFVSLVGHAANRQPFKIIKGEVKGEDTMNKPAIYNILVSKDVTEEKLQEIVKEHNFSIEEKIENALEGYNVYKQIEDNEVNLETKKIARLEDNVFAIVADLKEESEKDPIEKEMDYESMDKVADSMFAMMDIVLGTMRQPEAENRKEMIMSAVGNFTKYVEAALTEMKAEDVLGEYQIKSDLIKEFIPVEKDEEILPAVEFKEDEFEKKIKEELIAEFTEILEEKVKLVKEDVSETENQLKEDLNASLNDQFALYTKKEDLEKQVEDLKAEIEIIKNTAKIRNSEIEEDKKKPNKKQIVKKRNQFVTFV
jgi:hypothetical protein